MSMIKELRVAKGWNQAKLSVEAGVSITTVARLEKGTKQSPAIANKPTLGAVARALGVSPDEVEGVVSSGVKRAKQG